MECDVVAESTDGRHLLVGEVKLSVTTELSAMLCGVWETQCHAGWRKCVWVCGYGSVWVF